MMKLSNGIRKSLNALKRKKYRQKYQQFVIEGEKIFNEILTHYKKYIEYVVVHENCSIHLPESIQVYTADDTDFKTISHFATPDGYLMVLKQLAFEDQRYERMIYLDGVRDPGNLGTIIRTADWFGVSAVLCSHDTVDVYNPKVVHATMGSIMRIPVHYVEWEHIQLRYPSHHIFIADMHGQDVYETTLRSSNFIIVMGGESHGIRISAPAATNISIQKSSHSSIDSLNVAMATGIITSTLTHLSHQ